MSQWLHLTLSGLADNWQSGVRGVPQRSTSVSFQPHGSLKEGTKTSMDEDSSSETFCPGVAEKRAKRTQATASVTPSLVSPEKMEGKASRLAFRFCPHKDAVPSWAGRMGPNCSHGQRCSQRNKENICKVAGISCSPGLCHACDISLWTRRPPAPLSGLFIESALVLPCNRY